MGWEIRYITTSSRALPEQQTLPQVARIFPVLPEQQTVPQVAQIFPEQQTVLQVAQIFPASYGTHRFVTCLLQPNTYHTNTVHTLPFYFFNIHFIIIIFTPMPGSSKLSLSLRFSHRTGQNSISLHPCMSHNPHSPHSL